MKLSSAAAPLSLVLAFAVVLGACEHADLLVAAPPSPTLSSLQSSIFDVSCALSGCHVGPSPTGDLDLSEGESWANLVNVPSVGVPDLVRVEAGNPDSSYIILKLLGSPRIVGSQMPLGAGSLSESQIATISEWIEAGAEDDMAVDPPSPTLSSLQSSIFDDSCALSGCHVGPSAPSGLDLSEGESWANLVNIPSVGVPGLLRVEVGNPDSSYIILKLLGSPEIVGPQMPIGAEPLPESQIAAIGEWIEAGAGDN